jgi:hypothetical protein
MNRSGNIKQEAPASTASPAGTGGPALHDIRTGDAAGVSRWAGVAAVAFGVLVVVDGATTGGHPPDPDKSAAEILRWYAAHREGVFFMELLLAIAAGLLIFLAVEIHRSTRGGSARSSTAAGCFAASSVAFAALAVAGGWPQMTLAVTAGRPDVQTSAATIRLLSDMTWLHWSGQALIVVIAAASLGVLARAWSIAPRWIAWPCAVSVLAGCIGGTAAFFPAASGAENPLGVLGFISFVLFSITVLMTGIAFLARSPRTTGASSPSSTST